MPLNYHHYKFNNNNLIGGSSVENKLIDVKISDINETKQINLPILFFNWLFIDESKMSDNNSFKNMNNFNMFNELIEILNNFFEKP